MANDPDHHADKGYADLEPSSRLAGRRPATSSVDEEAESGSESDVSLDLASTAASGSENRLYLRLALYAGGNILTLLLVLGLWTVWTLLATFRHPMLWALLCSTALQDIKEDLVSYFSRVLAQDRSVITSCLLIAWLPFGVVTDTVADIWHILLKWNQYVREYENTSLRKVATEASSPFAQVDAPSSNVHHHSPAEQSPQPLPPVTDLPNILEQAASTSQEPPAVPMERKNSKRRASIKGPRSRRKRRRQLYVPPAFQALGSWLSAYTSMGVKAYKSEHGSRRPTKEDTVHTSHGAARHTTHHSNALFSWLFKACIAYQLYEWLWAHWSATVHFAFVAATAAFILSLLPFLYCGVHTYWQWHRTRQHSKEPPADMPDTDSSSEASGNQPGLQRAPSSKAKAAPPNQMRRRWVGVKGACRELDTGLKHALQANLDALVALALIVMLLVGSLALTGFMTVRIGQEGSDTVALVKTFIPDRWRAGGARQAPMCAATSLNFTAVCEADGGFDAIPEPTAQGAVQRWLGEYQETAVEYAQQGYDQISEYVKGNFNDYVEANNLTQVAHDLGTLWATLQPPTDCTPQQRQSLLLNVATASAAAHATWQSEQESMSKVAEAKQGLSGAITRWEGAAGDALQAPRGLLEAAQVGSHPIHDLQQQVVQLELQVKQHTGGLKTAGRLADAAREELVLAQRSLGRCSGGSSSPNTRQVVAAPGGNMGRRLQQAYSHLWKLQLSEGFTKLKEVGQDTYSMVRQGMQANSSASSELTALQRLAAAGSEPLLAVGRALGAHLVHSLGSTTSVAITGSLGLIRLGLGVVKLGVQFTLFVAMLFLLLSAQQDPLQQAVRILPMSETAREHTAASFSEALRGVFQSALKLAVFHAVFTWLTFRAFSVQMVYVSTLASAVCSVLPLVQVWMVAIPAALQLLMQDRMLAAAMLMVLHLGAFFQADDIIMREIPGSHPYLTGLGILGGMYSFDNPLQGALLGPMLLSMLSVFYNLHAKLFHDEAPSSERHYTGSHRATL